MPNAAASLDADFGQRPPARRKPAQAAPRKKGRKPSSARRFAMFDGVPRYGAIAISALIGVGIVVNALMMQHGSHPAPLFAGATPVPAPATPATAKSAAAKPEAVRPDAGAAPVDGPATVATAAAASPADAPARAAAHPAKAAHGDDLIARLIGAGPTGTAAHRTRAASDKPAGAKAAKVVGEKHRKSED